MLLYPLAILAFTRIAESGEDAIEAGRSPVAVWGTLPTAVGGHLAGRADLTLLPWAGASDDVREGLTSGRLVPMEGAAIDAAAPGPRRRSSGTRPGREIEPENPVLAAAREAVAARTAEVVIVAWADAAPAVERGAAATVTIYYDSVRRESVVAQGRVADALSDAREAVVAERQRARRLPDGFAEALTLERRNTARAERRTGQLLGALLPYVLLTLSVLGGMYAAIDLTAGEKERGTMQTLLVAPIRPAEIVVAKFLAVWLLSMLSLVANLASLSLTVSRLLPADAPGIGAGNLVLAMVVLVPVTLTTSAIFLTMASFARDFRDGQTLLTPVYMAVALPAAVVAMPTHRPHRVDGVRADRQRHAAHQSAVPARGRPRAGLPHAALGLGLRGRGHRRRRARVPPRDRARRREARRCARCSSGAARPTSRPTPASPSPHSRWSWSWPFYGSLSLRGWPVHWLVLVLQYRRLPAADPGDGRALRLRLAAHAGAAPPADRWTGRGGRARRQRRGSSPAASSPAAAAARVADAGDAAAAFSSATSRCRCGWCGSSSA